MRLLLLALLVATAPASAQGAPADDVTPDAVLGATWAEVLGGATAASWALDEAAATDAAGAANTEALDDVRAGLLTAALGSAASAGGLTAALQFSLALADPAERAQVAAALSDDTAALGGLLVLVAEEATAAAVAPTYADLDASGSPAMWAERAEQIRALVGRLEGATAALGIAAP